MVLAKSNLQVLSIEVRSQYGELYSGLKRQAVVSSGANKKQQKYWLIGVAILALSVLHLYKELKR